MLFVNFGFFFGQVIELTPTAYGCQEAFVPLKSRAAKRMSLVEEHGALEQSNSREAHEGTCGAADHGGLPSHMSSSLLSSGAVPSLSSYGQVRKNLTNHPICCQCLPSLAYGILPELDNRQQASLAAQHVKHNDHTRPSLQRIPQALVGLHRCPQRVQIIRRGAASNSSPGMWMSVKNTRGHTFSEHTQTDRRIRLVSLF